MKPKILGALVAILYAAAATYGGPWPTTGVNYPGGTAANWIANASTGSGVPGGPDAIEAAMGFEDMSTVGGWNPATAVNTSTDIAPIIGAHMYDGKVLDFSNCPAGYYTISNSVPGGIGYGEYGSISHCVIKGRGEDLGTGTGTTFKIRNGGFCHFGDNTLGPGGGGPQATVAVKNTSFTQGQTTLNIAGASPAPGVGSYMILTEAQDITNPATYNPKGPANATGFYMFNQITNVASDTSGDGGTYTITLQVPVTIQLKTALGPQVAYIGNNKGATAVGVEDCTIDMSDSSAQPFFAVGFAECTNFWVRNVYVKSFAASAVSVQFGVQGQLQHFDYGPSTITSGGPGAGGIQSVGEMTNMLIENCVCVGVQPLIEISYNSHGTVIGYNCCYNTTTSSYPGPAIDTNHGSANAFTLVEGNITPNEESDSFYGGELSAFHYKNYFEGTDPGNPNISTPLNAYPGVRQNRFNRDGSTVGNIFGQYGATWTYSSYPPYATYGISMGLPYIGSGSAYGTAALSLNNPWADWGAVATGYMVGQVISGQGTTSGVIKFTTGNPTAGQQSFWYNGVEGDDQDGANINWSGGSANIHTASYQSGAQGAALVAVTTWDGALLPTNGTAITSAFAGSFGFGELDADVYNTFTIGANYDVINANEPSQDSFNTSAYTFPGSLYRSSVPFWWGGLAWPAFPIGSVPSVIETSSTVTVGANPFHGAGTFPAYFALIPAGYRFLYGTDPSVAPASLTAVNVTFH